MAIALAQKKKKTRPLSDQVFRDFPSTSRFVTRSVLLDIGRECFCPLFAAHVTKREWILSLALTSFKEFTATLTRVVHRNNRFRFFGF